MHPTLPLVVGVIFAPNCLIVIICLFALVWVIAGLGFSPCVLTLNYNHRLTSDLSQASR